MFRACVVAGEGGGGVRFYVLVLGQKQYRGDMARTAFKDTTVRTRSGYLKANGLRLPFDYNFGKQKVVALTAAVFISRE